MVVVVVVVGTAVVVVAPATATCQLRGTRRRRKAARATTLPCLPRLAPRHCSRSSKLPSRRRHCSSMTLGLRMEAVAAAAGGGLLPLGLASATHVPSSSSTGSRHSCTCSNSNSNSSSSKQRISTAYGGVGKDGPPLRLEAVLQGTLAHDGSLTLATRLARHTATTAATAAAGTATRALARRAARAVGCAATDLDPPGRRDPAAAAAAIAPAHPSRRKLDLACTGTPAATGMHLGRGGAAAGPVAGRRLLPLAARCAPLVGSPTSTSSAVARTRPAALLRRTSDSLGRGPCRARLASPCCEHRVRGLPIATPAALEAMVPATGPPPCTGMHATPALPPVVSIHQVGQAVVDRVGRCRLGPPCRCWCVSVLLTKQITNSHEFGVSVAHSCTPTHCYYITLSCKCGKHTLARRTGKYVAKGNDHAARPVSPATPASVARMTHARTPKTRPRQVNHSRSRLPLLQSEGAPCGRLVPERWWPAQRQPRLPQRLHARVTSGSRR